MFLDDASRDGLAEHLHVATKSAADVQFPCALHRGFNAARPHHSRAQETPLVSKAQPVPLSASSPFLGQKLRALVLQVVSVGNTWGAHFNLLIKTLTAIWTLPLSDPRSKRF